jgi:hypothetical protein
MRLVRPTGSEVYVRRCRRLQSRGLSDQVCQNLIDAGDWDLLQTLERTTAGELARLSAVAELNLPDGRPRVGALLEECDRADQLAGAHGGFVTTAKIRELLGNAS